MSVLEASLSGLVTVLSWPTFGFLMIGVLVGLIFGAIPGIGGITAFIILFPLLLNLGAEAAFALIIGLFAVTTTSDTVSSVLLGVPGTAGSQATILDGHAMAKKGEAARALGAAYVASAIGGVFGALVLAVGLQILRPLVLLLQSPEFFALGLWGITMVSVLSGKTPLKGIIMGILGLMLATVGIEMTIGIERYTFGQMYLLEGIPTGLLALGLFGIPELMSLAIGRTSISRVPPPKDLLRNQLEGAKDVLKHWSLVLRCSSIGILVGFIPGLGSSVVDWIAYGHALQTCPGARDSFGQGDVRGVIAPESANNAKDGGSLIPTVAFGIPGSLSMVLLLSVLISLGITPGRDMMTTHLDLTFTIIWSLALSNIVGTGICLAATNFLVRVVFLPYAWVIASIIPVIFLAAFSWNGSAGDLYTLMFFSVIGFFMKIWGWPRPPFILGFVLGPILENRFFITLNLYGLTWLYRPWFLLIMALIVGTLLYPMFEERRQKAKRERAGA